MSVPAQAGRVLPGGRVTRMPSLVGPTFMWGLFVLTFLGACGPPSPKTTRNSPSPTDGKEVPKMELTSSAFANGQPIPKKYTGAGADVSPPLTWSDPPEGTRSLALICDDPDAPSAKNPRPEGPWVHWVIYNIPADVRSLPEGLPRQAKLEKPAGALQGRNDFSGNNIGYSGPMPPPGSGPHRYFFKIYALDTTLSLDPQSTTKAKLLEAIQGHILAEGQLMGTFER